MAIRAVTQNGASIALACRTFQISETCYRYSPVLSDENEEIADWSYAGKWVTVFEKAAYRGG